MDEPTVPDPQPNAPPPLDLRNRLGLRIVVNAVLPLGVYTLVRGHVGSDAAGLAIAAALPAAWTLVHFAVRRHVDAIGLFAVLGFALALAVSVFFGGNSLAFKLRRPAVSGAIGVVLLVSAAVRRPLLLPLLRRLAGVSPAVAGVLHRVATDPRARRRLTIATAAIGGILVFEAVFQTILAVTLPTTVWLSLKPIFGIGLVLVLVVLRARRFSTRRTGSDRG